MIDDVVIYAVVSCERLGILCNLFELTIPVIEWLAQKSKYNTKIS